MADELKSLMYEALESEKLIGSGIPTEIMGKIGDVNAEDLISALPMVLENSPKIMDKVLSEMETIETGDIIDFLPKFMSINEKMQDLDPSDLSEVLPKMTEFIPKIMPVLISLIDKVIATDDDLSEELENAEDLIININAGGIMTICMQIKDGKMHIGTELADSADMSMEIPMDVMLNLMTGTGDPMSAFMGGDVNMEGDISKAMGIMPLMGILSEKFGFEMM
ncbi:MAG: SCP2 sterol-binding domain-containing protein [Halobacteriota archaeon]|nr:SCP2 sterol-binding domain-containing protein [Halobacteriota archaeon]